VERLLKIADPTGEEFRKWEVKKSLEGKQEPASQSRPTSRVFPSMEDAKELATSVEDVRPESSEAVQQEGTVDAVEQKADDNVNRTAPSEEEPAVLPGLDAPLRLGAPMAKPSEEVMPEVSHKVDEEAGNFIPYKDRKKGVGGKQQFSGPEVVSKRDGAEEGSVVDSHIADSVALLLRHKRGLVAEDPDLSQNTEQGDLSVEEKRKSKQSSKKRKKQGPKNQFQSTETDNSEEWAPPTGMTKSLSTICLFIVSVFL
jgi:hypothetical protein